MEFDAVVGNPPYQIEVAKKQSETNGQVPRKNIFQYFQLAADDIATGYTSLIYPGSRWIHRSGKGMKEFGLNQINDKRLSRVEYFPVSEDIFKLIDIPDGISVVFKNMKKTDPGFDFTYCKGDEKATWRLDPPGEDLIPLNPRDGKILQAVKKFVIKNELTYVSERVLPRSLFEIESDFVEKNPHKVRPLVEGCKFDSNSEIKLLTNDKAGPAGRAHWYITLRKVIKVNQQHIDAWKVVVSSAHPGGQENRDWQLSIVDNHSAFGRARVGLGSFKTKAEADNFYAYCNTYLIRFLFLMTEESLTSLAKKVPDVLDYTKNNKLLDFAKDLNAQLYALCGLTPAEVKYVEKTIIDMDTARSRRKTQED